LLHNLDSKNTKLILAGDYNINLLSHAVHSETENFLNILYAHSILPMIKRPTRYGENSATLIDNILTNKLDDNQLSGIILHDISDHLPVFLITSAIGGTAKTVTRYIIKNIREINETSLTGFADKLQSTAWQENESQDVNITYDIFNNRFCELYNETLPVVNKKIKIYCNKYKPWITTGILKSVKKKNTLYKKFLIKKSPDSKEIYIKYKNKLTNVIRNSQKSYYNMKFETMKGNMRETWKLINKVLHSACGISTKQAVNKISSDGRLLSDPLEIATKFNDFFTNIGPNLANKIPAMPKNSSIKDTMPVSNGHSLFVEPCTETEIINVVNKLANSKGIGLDGYSVKVIKHVISKIAFPLSLVFNQSFYTGIFPEKLKHAKVTPIFKNDDKLIINNYRPISVLPIFSKILEKLMHTRITAFISKYNILYENQYGFREKHSTHLAMINMIDQISEEMDAGNYSIGIFLDLSKAFDTIDHNILLQKLEIYGIRGIALQWLSSYLANRSQCVVIGDTVSAPSTVKCGVPQGSVLGPLLFILYINDIVRSSSLFKFIMFADDTNLFMSHKNLNQLTELVNQELISISNWLKLNKLSLNIKKTHFILFHFRQKKISEQICV
jgi:hypothetical protein